MAQYLTEPGPRTTQGRVQDPFALGPQRKSWKDVSPGDGWQWGVEEPHNFAKQFAAASGFGGNPLVQGGPGRMVEGESGSFMEPGSDWNISPEFENHLNQFTWETGASGKNQHPWMKAYDASGNPVAGGQQFTVGDNGSRSVDRLMQSAVAAMAAQGLMQGLGGAGGALDPMTTDLGGFGTSGLGGTGSAMPYPVSVGDGGFGMEAAGVGGSDAGFMEGAFQSGGVPGIQTPPLSGAAPAASSGWQGALESLMKPFSLGKAGAASGITGNAIADTVLGGALPALGMMGAQRLFAGKAPDYAGALRDAATQQGQANIASGQATAGINRVNTSTPYGSQQFTPVQDPSWPGGVRWEQNINLSPEQQQLYNLETGNQIASQQIAGGMQQQLRDAVSNPFSLNSVGSATQLPGSADAFSAERQKVTQSLFDRLSGLRKPQMDRAKEQLDTRLRQQGHMPTDAAYRNAMGDLEQQQSQELADMAQRAEVAGGAEQSRLFEMLQSGAGFNNQVRNQGIQELLLQRQQPLQEYNAFRTGNTPTLPQFQPFGMGSVSPTPVLQGAQQAYGAAADSYNSRVGQLQQLLNFFSKMGG